MNDETKSTEAASLRLSSDSIFAEYELFKTKRNELNRSLIWNTGFVVNIATHTEAIIKYITVKEGLETDRADVAALKPGEISSLVNNIKTLRNRNIIDNQIYHHLNNIRVWRNWGVHDNSNGKGSHEPVSDSTVDSVYDSFNKVRNWFFREYLKNEFPDLTAVNNLNEVKSTISDSKFNSEVEKKNKVTSNKKLDYEVQRNKSEPSKSVKYARVLLVLIIVVGGFYIFKWVNAKKVWTGDETVSVRSVNDVYDYLNQYSQVANGGDYDPYDYFADTVKQYYLIYNQTPEQILNDKSKKDFQYGVQTIDKSTLAIRYSEGDITYWHFWAEFKCYRPSKGRQTVSKVHMEYGITNDWKITAIRQLDLIPIKK